MKLSARSLLGVLALSIASFTPVLPGARLPAVEQKTACWMEVNVNACHRCPINPGGGNSSSATSSCTPACCVPLYFGNAHAFAADAKMSGTISMNDDRTSARSQRPPVPPPRTAFS